MAMVILTVFLFAACSREQEASTSANTGTPQYFDLKALVEKDIKDNTENGCKEEKSVLVNGNRETKTFTLVDWEEELRLLLDSDINKPAWKGKYLVDTIQTTVTGITSIQHRALSDKVNVKTLIIERKGDEIQRIFIQRKIRSFIFSSGQAIEYFPGKGFTIRGEQRAALMNTLDMNVEVVYKCD